MEIVDDRAWVEIATWTSPTPNGRFCSLSFTRNQFGSEGDHVQMPAPRSTGFFGCCAPALPGTICPTAIRTIKLAIAASSSGSATGPLRDSCTPSQKTCGPAANWICRRPSSTPASVRRKKGHCRQQCPFFRQTGFVGDLHRRQLQFGEKRGTAVGPTRRGKGSKIMAIADGHGFPVACDLASASPHETKLVEGTLQHRFTRTWPERMIGDTAYDSDPLDRQLWREHRIRMIAPNRPNRLNLTQ